MVKFAFFVAYNLQRSVLSPWIAVSGADAAPLPFLSCTGRRTCQRASSWQQRQRNKVRGKLVTLRGLDSFGRVSPWENNSFPSQPKEENNRKWHPLYILNIFCTFIYRLISSNRFFSSFRASCWLGRIWSPSRSDERHRATLAENWSRCSFCSFFFPFYIFNNRHVNPTDREKSKRRNDLS